MRLSRSAVQAIAEQRRVEGMVVFAGPGRLVYGRHGADRREEESDLFPHPEAASAKSHC